MSHIVIDAALCLRDGLCSAVCPYQLLPQRDAAAPPAPVGHAGALCMRCGHCVAICPAGAITVEGQGAADCAPVDPALAVTPAQVDQLLRGRRSIRRFKSEPLTRAELERLLEVARHAPTAANRQTAGFIVADSAERLRPVAEVAIAALRAQVEKDPVANAYYVPVVKAWDAGVDTLTHGAPAAVFFHDMPGQMGTLNCAIAAQHLELAAHARGLGATWWGFLNVVAAFAPALDEVLGIPKGARLHCALLLGRPRYHYERMPPRRARSVRFL